MRTPSITSPYAPDLAKVRAWLEAKLAARLFVEIVVTILALLARMRDVNTVDQLVEGVAHEAKVGYQSLTPVIARQIAKDAELIGARQIEGATWHFFRSPVTGRIGPSGPLLNALEQAGIIVRIH